MIESRFARGKSIITGQNSKSFPNHQRFCKPTLVGPVITYYLEIQSVQSLRCKDTPK